MVSCLLSSADFSPDSLPASCGALAPFRLCSLSQPQSSPRDLTSEAQASAPRPDPPRWGSKQASQAGECWLAPILCAGISPLCPLHPCCCALLRGSEASPPATPRLRQWRGFLVCGNFSSFTAPSQRCRSHPYSFVCVFSFFFCPTQVHEEFLAFGEVWSLLPVFSRCSVGVVAHVDVFLMYLWRGRWSPCLTPLPSWRSVLTGSLSLMINSMNFILMRYPMKINLLFFLFDFPIFCFGLAFLPVLSGYNWHAALYKFKVYSIMIWLTYII